MPRAKPNKASPHFISRGYRLSDAAKVKLVELLGHGKVDLLEESVRHQLPGKKILKSEPDAPLLLVNDPNAKPYVEQTDVGEIILDIEQALGIYVDGAQHLDHIPRPTHYVNTFRPIERQARKLSELLFEMGYYFSQNLSTRNLDPNKIAVDLLELAEVSKAIIGDFKGKPSKGAQRNTALTEVIRRLRRIFRDRYRGERTGRTRRGAFQFRAEEEKRELAFVKTALRDRPIIPASYKELPRLFRDPRCALHEDGAATVERIANKVHPKRERKQKENIP